LFPHFIEAQPESQPGQQSIAQGKIATEAPEVFADKINLADVVIDNQGSIAETEKKVTEVWKLLQHRERNKTN
jgi:dephospho-CoA kinase